MFAIKHYDVKINDSEGEVVSETVYNATLLFMIPDNYSNSTFTVTIRVVDIRGQRSNSTVIIKTYGMYVKYKYVCLLVHRQIKKLRT